MSSYNKTARAAFRTPFGRRMVPGRKEAVMLEHALWERCDEQARASRQAFAARRLHRAPLAAPSSPSSGAADPRDSETERASRGQSGSLARGVDRPRGEGAHVDEALALLAAVRLTTARLGLCPPPPCPVPCPVSMAREAEEGAKEKRKAAEELAWKKRNAAEEAEWKKRKAAGEAERRKRKAADDAEKRRQEAEDAMDIEEENEVCAMLDDLSLEHDENENEDEDEDVETEDAGKMTAAVDAPLAPASTRKPSRTPIHLQLPFEQRQAHVPRVVFALRQPEEQARTATELAAAAALVGLWSEGRLQPSVRRRVAPLPKRKVVSVASRSGQAGVARA